MQHVVRCIALASGPLAIPLPVILALSPGIGLADNAEVVGY